VETEVAAIAAAIALLALVVSFVVARRQTAIQERLTAIEEARRAEEVEARGRARVTATIRPPWEWLTLHNEGPALARDVEAEVVSLDDSPPPTISGLGNLFGFQVNMQPGQTMPFWIERAREDAEMVEVTVRWTDEAGSHEEPYQFDIH
jgi:hypothetical protein